MYNKQKHFSPIRKTIELIDLGNLLLYTQSRISTHISLLKTQNLCWRFH